MVALKSGQGISRIDVLLRILATLVYLPVLLLVMTVFSLMASVEQLYALILGKTPPLTLLRVADRIVCYAGQIANYLILVDSRAPFPFSPIPPASALFTEQLNTGESATGYAGAEDTTLMPSGDGLADGDAHYADAEDQTSLNQSAESGLVAQHELDLDLGLESVEGTEANLEDSTQLNPDKDAEDLLDDTLIQGVSEAESTEERVEEEDPGETSEDESSDESPALVEPDDLDSEGAAADEERQETNRSAS
ncbi:MAG: DUF4389 domain-containing protein [Gammaproteobacteria bacterium]